MIFAPVKSHEGLFGTGLAEVRLDPVGYGDPAASGRALQGRRRHLRVCTNSKNAVRKAMAKIGKRALPELATCC
jgi:hypothetical protein